VSTQKLQLTWIWKDRRIKLEPRILIEDKDKTYWDPDSGNMLIHWDNLLALKALEQEYTGKIKCIYIDPPYNTGNAFEHYDDWLEHSEWLNLMKPRIDILRRLLADDGSIWISIDDDESHYLKVLCDEIFWRKNFVSNVIWEKKHTRSNDAKWLSDNHDHILVYAKNKEIWRPFMLPRTEEMNSSYKNPDNDPRWPWMSQPIQVKTPSEAYIYEISNPAWETFLPPKWRSWQFWLKRYNELVVDNRIWFWGKWTNVPRIKKFLTDVQDGLVPLTIWYRTEVWDNQEAKMEVKQVNEDAPFATPKPERLIQRVLSLSTKEWDIVLDSFLWSWTTSAVAHKMWRKWIWIEMWNHAYTHCKVRLDKVVNWEDKWGITESVWWIDWGGYKFYELGPSLLARDEHWRYIINPNMNGEMLTRALCKIENFKYMPKDWDLIKHWFSTEKDFLHVTTRMIDQETIERIASKNLSEDESLLIMSKTIEKWLRLPPNIQVKKIPNEIFRKYEYAKDDYSLPILSETREKLIDLKILINDLPYNQTETWD